MGCYDLYCFLCGNPCHGMFNDIYDRFLIHINEYEKTNHHTKYYKKYFEEIYSKYKENPEDFIKRLKNIKQNSLWMNDCTFLGVNGTIAHNCKNTLGDLDFEDNLKRRYRQSTFYQHITYGLFVHSDCWNFIKNEYKIELSYFYLPIFEKELFPTHIFTHIKK